MKPLDLLAGLVVSALWGTNFAVVKLGVSYMPPFLFTTLRFVVIAALLVPFFRLPRSKMLDVALFSFLLGTCHFGLMFFSMRGMDAATMAIIMQTCFPFSALCAAILYKERLGWIRFLGMVLSFGGVALLVGEPTFPTPFFFMLAIVSALGWVFSNIAVKRIGRIEPLALSGWMALFGIPQLLILSLIFETGQWQVLSTFHWGMIFPVFYTAIMASIAAYTLWYRLLLRYQLNQVVPFTLLNPVFGVSMGILLLGESLTWHRLAGGAVTVTGVALIQLGPVFLSRWKKQAPAP